MKRLFKRITAMSTLLVLFCVTAIAQNAKNMNGVIVSPTEVNIAPDKEKNVIVTPNPGYYHPTIYYNGQTYEIGQSFQGKIFKIEPATSPYSFKIISKKDVYEQQSEEIYIFVEEALVNYKLGKRNISSSDGVKITITVTPGLNDD